MNKELQTRDKPTGNNSFYLIKCSTNACENSICRKRARAYSSSHSICSNCKDKKFAFHKQEIKRYYLSLVGKTKAQRVYLTRDHFGLSKSGIKRLLEYRSSYNSQKKIEKFDSIKGFFYPEEFFKIRTKNGKGSNLIFKQCFGGTAKKILRELASLPEIKEKIKKNRLKGASIVKKKFKEDEVFKEAHLKQLRVARKNRIFQGVKNSYLRLLFIYYDKHGNKISFRVRKNGVEIKKQGFSINKHGLEAALLLALCARDEHFAKHPHIDYNPVTGLFRQDVIN